METYKYFDPKDLKEIAYVKRLMEYDSLIPGFQQELTEDPSGTLAKYGFSFSPQDVSFLPNTIEGGDVIMHAAFPDTPAEKYAEFMRKKTDQRGILRRLCEPDNPSMKKWRARQIGRCTIQLGTKFSALIHAPFSIELSDGCSVGCDFCGLKAGRLKSVFRYTPENAALFNEILSAVREVIGPAAGQGTLYFASEPLDNPDYEKFMEDYIRCFDTIPQITTARADLNIERLRPLLDQINGSQKAIYRFSMLSEEMTRKIFDAFTPEELILTELLPQYDEAPASGLVNAGRRAKEDKYEDTISCMSGFVVNLARRDIKLTTPVWASKDHPTGECILEIATFTSGEEFKEILEGMISRHMTNIIAPDDRIKLEDGLSLKINEGNVVISTDKYVNITLETKGDPSMFGKLFDVLGKGYKLKRDIVEELCHPGEGKLVPPEIVYFILNKWWGLGFIRTESGKL